VVRSGFIWWRVLAVAWFCGLFLDRACRALGQQPAASQSSENHSTGGSSHRPLRLNRHRHPLLPKPQRALKKLQAIRSASEEGSSHQRQRSHRQQAKNARAGPSLPEYAGCGRRLWLRPPCGPLAQQLFQDRSPAAYAGVEAYALPTPRKMRVLCMAGCGLCPRSRSGIRQSD